MNSKTKHSIIKGTIILTIAGVITRCIGFYNRIFLSHLIGARELGIYQLIFPIYTIAFSFCCQGIQTALTKQVSEIQLANKLPYYCYTKVALQLSVFLAIITSCFLYFNAQWIAVNILHASECGSNLKILSLAIPFIAIKGCIIGYFIGMQNSSVSAIAQLIACCIVILTYILHIKKDTAIYSHSKYPTPYKYYLRPILKDAIPLTGMALPFIYLSTTLASILNGIGLTTRNLLYSILSIAIRISFILFVIPIYGLRGYMWGMLCSYLSLTILLTITTQKHTRFIQ